MILSCVDNLKKPVRQYRPRLSQDDVRDLVDGLNLLALDIAEKELVSGKSERLARIFALMCGFEAILKQED